jgi:hypothetical protein
MDKMMIRDMAPNPDNQSPVRIPPPIWTDSTSVVQELARVNNRFSVIENTLRDLTEFLRNTDTPKMSGYSTARLCQISKLRVVLNSLYPTIKIGFLLNFLGKPDFRRVPVGLPTKSDSEYRLQSMINGQPSCVLPQ